MSMAILARIAFTVGGGWSSSASSSYAGSAGGAADAADFALGLVAWVGYTIATIQVEADASPEVLHTDVAETSSDSESEKPAVATDAA